MRPHALPLTVGLSALLCGCIFGGKDKDVDSADGGWIVDEVDLGTAKASGEGFEIGNGTELWFAAEQFVPELAHTYPASSIPLFAWEEVALGQNIADVGSCPFTYIEDGAQIWDSDCRSQEGYEWAGEVAVSEWEDDTGRWTRWDMDLEIIGDVEDPSFDRMVLDGSFVFVAGDPEVLTRAVQSNIRVGLDGWFERHSVADGREEAWQDWVLTGRYEETPDGHHFAGDVDLGNLGGLHFESDGLVKTSACPVEPRGEVHIEADDDVVIEFDGDSSCNRCGDMVVDGTFSGQACGT